MAGGQSNPLWGRVLVSECHAVHLCAMHALLRLQMYVCMHLCLYTACTCSYADQRYVCTCKRLRSHSSVCVRIHRHVCAYTPVCQNGTMRALMQVHARGCTCMCTIPHLCVTLCDVRLGAGACLRISVFPGKGMFALIPRAYAAVTCSVFVRAQVYVCACKCVCMCVRMRKCLCLRACTPNCTNVMECACACTCAQMHDDGCSHAQVLVRACICVSLRNIVRAYAHMRLLVCACRRMRALANA